MKTVFLKDICESSIDVLKKNDILNIEYIDISSVNNISKKIESSQFFNTSNAPSRAKQLIKQGDILVSTVRPNLNAVAMVDINSADTLVASTGFCVLRCKREILNKYVFYFCQSQSFINYMTSQATGASYPAVTSSIVKNARLPFVSLETQKKIVENLDSVEKVIRWYQELLSVIDKTVKARFVELFGDIHEPSKWEKKPWSELVTIQNGRDYKNILVESGGYPVYGTGGEMARASDYLCPENTIIVGRKGTINNPLLVKEKFWNVDTAFGVIVGNQLHYQYFYNFCRMFDFSTLNKQAVLPSTTKADLLKIEIAVPPMELQNQFAAFVEQTDKSKLEIQKGLEKLELLKKSLMQKYFG